MLFDGNVLCKDAVMLGNARCEDAKAVAEGLWRCVDAVRECSLGVGAGAV